MTHEESESAIDEAKELVLDLVVAMLAVNRWGLERTGSLGPAIQAARLDDLERITSMTVAELAAALGACGYRRGLYLEQLLATRIHRAAITLRAGALQRLLDSEQSGDAQNVQRILLSLDGVGPEVAKNYLLLRST